METRRPFFTFGFRLLIVVVILSMLRFRVNFLLLLGSHALEASLRLSRGWRILMMLLWDWCNFSNMTKDISCCILLLRPLSCTYTLICFSWLFGLQYNCVHSEDRPILLWFRELFDTPYGTRHNVAHNRVLLRQVRCEIHFLPFSRLVKGLTI